MIKCDLRLGHKTSAFHVDAVASAFFEVNNKSSAIFVGASTKKDNNNNNINSRQNPSVDKRRADTINLSTNV